jgi:hypothetical protein
MRTRIAGFLLRPDYSFYCRSYGGVSKEYSIAYTRGQRYSHLERIPGKPEMLEPLFAPR